MTKLNIKTDDLSHLAGRRIIKRIIATDTGNIMYVIVEAVLVEYDMGITLKPVAHASNVHNERCGTTCLNGKSSPNQEAYIYWKDTYDKSFQYIVDCLENHSIYQSDIASKIVNLPNIRDNYGTISCATGMPV